jgi:hypothetical protein
MKSLTVGVLAALLITSPAVAAKDTRQEFFREYRTSVAGYKVSSPSLLKDVSEWWLLGDGYRFCALLEKGNTQAQVMENYVRREFTEFDPTTSGWRYGWLYAAHVSDAAIEKLCPRFKDGISGMSLLPWNK